MTWVFIPMCILPMDNKKKGKFANDILDDLLVDDSLELTGTGLPLSDEDATAYRKPAEEEDDKTHPLSEMPNNKTKKSDVSYDATEPLYNQVPKRPSIHEPQGLISDPKPASTEGDSQSLSDKVRSSVGKMFSTKSQNFQKMSPVEVSLAQSESVRFAQERIIELEHKVQAIRNENEELMAAGENLKKQIEGLTSRCENAESRLREQKQYVEDEKRILYEALQQKDRDLARDHQKLETVEARLSANMQKIRIREKELENRLELVKMESAALLQNKNEIILDLKKSIDQLNMELDNYRSKSNELNRTLDNKQETLRRTVRTLRMALTMLEGSDIISDNEKNKTG